MANCPSANTPPRRNWMRETSTPNHDYKDPYAVHDNDESFVMNGYMGYREEDRPVVYYSNSPVLDDFPRQNLDQTFDVSPPRELRTMSSGGGTMTESYLKTNHPMAYGEYLERKRQRRAQNAQTGGGCCVPQATVPAPYNPGSLFKSSGANSMCQPRRIGGGNPIRMNVSYGMDQRNDTIMQANREVADELDLYNIQDFNSNQSRYAPSKIGSSFPNLSPFIKRVRNRNEPGGCGPRKTPSIGRFESPRFEGLSQSFGPNVGGWVENCNNESLGSDYGFDQFEEGLNGRSPGGYMQNSNQYRNQTSILGDYNLTNSIYYPGGNQSVRSRRMPSPGNYCPQDSLGRYSNPFQPIAPVSQTSSPRSQCQPAFSVPPGGQQQNYSASSASGSNPASYQGSNPAAYQGSNPAAYQGSNPASYQRSSPESSTGGDSIILGNQAEKFSKQIQDLISNRLAEELPNLITTRIEASMNRIVTDDILREAMPGLQNEVVKSAIEDMVANSILTLVKQVSGDSSITDSELSYLNEKSRSCQCQPFYHDNKNILAPYLGDPSMGGNGPQC